MYRTYGALLKKFVPWTDKKAVAADLKAIYTTNAIESLNRMIRTAINKRKVFPSDQTAFNQNGSYTEFGILSTTKIQCETLHSNVSHWINNTDWLRN